jgi:hypothetical protein
VSRDPTLSRGGLLAWAFDYSSCITIPAKRRGPHYVPTSLPQEIVLPSMRERVLETPLPVSEAESCALSLDNASPTDLNDDSVMTLEHFGENTAKPSDPLSQPRSEAQASARRHESADTVETPNLENAQSTAPQQHDSRCAYSAEPEPPISQLGTIGTKNNDDQNPQCRPPPTPVEPESEARQELCSQKPTANSPSMAAALPLTTPQTMDRVVVPADDGMLEIVAESPESNEQLSNSDFDLGNDTIRHDAIDQFLNNQPDLAHKTADRDI